VDILGKFWLLKNILNTHKIVLTKIKTIMKKRFFLLSLLIATTMMASADVVKTIGDPTKVAGTYDYTSLYSACVDLKANPLTANTIWEICTDLDEHLNSGIISNSEFTLTIRPNADEDRIITFDAAKDNSGPSGNFVIGGDVIAGLTNDNSTNIPFATSGATTKNIVIDGYADGGSTRRLKIKGGDIGGTAILIYGDITNTTIKNCIVESTRESGSGYDITIRTKQNSDIHPVGVVIDNCELISTSSTSGQGIYFNSSKKSTVAGLVENTIIRNCEINVEQRGLFIWGANNLDVLNCTFKINNTGTGLLAHGIMGYSYNGTGLNGTFNVKGCKFIELKTNNTSANDYGVQGITASGGATVWNIENNIFTGIDALNADVDGAKAIKLCAVRCGDPCVVRHNTFVMPTLTNHPTTAVMSAYPISLLYLAGTTNTVQNNIFVSHETVANNSLIRGAMNAECTGNVFYHDGGNAKVVAGAAICENMNNVRASYPTQAATSKWMNVEFDANMALNGKSIDNVILSVPAIAEVPVDINGATRNNPTYAGAEEPSVMPTISALYMVGGNNEWNPTIGTPMEEISAGVYQGEFTFDDTKYFAFVTALESDPSAWTALNTHRFATEIADENVTNVTANLVYGFDRSMLLPRGKFRITVNTNGMYIKVLQLFDNLYEFGDNQSGWHANVGIPMTQVSENVFEGDFTFTKPINYFAFASEMANDDNDDAWAWLNGTVRYAGAEDVVRLDDAFEVAVGKGNRSFTILPGVYHFVVDMNLMKITVTQSIAKVIITDAGFATYYNGNKAYTMPLGMKGYVYNTTNGLEEVFDASTETKNVGAEVPLVLRAAPGTYDLVFTDNGLTPDIVSKLRGTDFDELTTAPGEGEYYFYGLSLAAEPNDTPESVGFYWMEDGGAAFVNGAHKAYLALPVSNSLAPAILFNENGATNIENLDGNEKVVKFVENGRVLIRKNGVVYDAMGRVVR
jgi:hypothetical protein